MIERDENVVAPSAMVPSLPALIKNKIIVHNNSLRLTFTIRMMSLFRVSTIVEVQVRTTKLSKNLYTLVSMDSLSFNFDGGSK